MFLNMGLFYQIIKIRLKDAGSGNLMVVKTAVTWSFISVDHSSGGKPSGKIFIDKDDG